MQRSQQTSEWSGGAFDITVKPLVDLYQHYANADALPPNDLIQQTLTLVDYRKIAVERNRVSLERDGHAVTLDGIAKGYIVDKGVEVLRQHGYADVLVEAGGDLMAAGQKAAHTPWKVGIRSPRQETSGLIASFTVQDRAVATSGDYMESFTPDFAHHHIIDPRTEYSASGLASATVMAANATWADGLATVLMTLGVQSGPKLVGSLPSCEAYLVSKDLQTFQANLC